MLLRTLEDIINKALMTESVGVDEVSDAIDNHRRIIINYHSKGEDIATGPRVAEVYAYGLTTAGNPVIRVFQPYGDTRTRVPGWKFMRLDRISGWKPTRQTFSRPASFYYRGLGEFNPNGDESMSVVYKVAKFGPDDENYTIVTNNSGPKLKNQEENPILRNKGTDAEVFKTDAERRMERLRQQLANPITLSDLKTANGMKGTENEPKTAEGPRTKEPDKDEELDNPQTEVDAQEELRNAELDNAVNAENTQDVGREEEKDGVFKTDTERRMAQLRNNLQNARKIDLSQIPKR